MLETEVYSKTDAGREEIRSRTLGLPMASRAILLMVDGQRTVASMRTLIAGSKAPPDILESLVAQGLIETKSAAVAAPPQAPAPVPVPAPVPAAPPPAPHYVIPVSTQAPVTAPKPAEPFVAPIKYDGPIDLVLPTIYGPEHVEQPAVGHVAPPVGPGLDRYEHLYAMMNEIVRDFLAPHRRYFFQLKIERCTTAEELLELLHGLQTALAKARGDAFASDVIARLRSAALG